MIASTKFNKHKNDEVYLVPDITIYCRPLFLLVRGQLGRVCHVTVEVGEFTKIVARDGIKYRPIPVGMRNLIQEKTISFPESALPLSSGTGNGDDRNADSLGRRLKKKTKAQIPLRACASRSLKWDNKQAKKVYGAFSHDVMGKRRVRLHLTK